MNRILCYGWAVASLLSLPLWADEPISPHGQRALALETQAWEQDETEHFVVHYAQSFVGKPVGQEAEYYYRMFIAELGLLPQPGEPRCHLFIFENREGWAAFSRGERLEAWTGAVAIGLELFVPRYPEYRFKGNALGHEVVHLVMNRYLPGPVPLWLSEGYAEEASARAYALYLRRQRLRVRPVVPPVEQPFTMEELLAFTEYPQGPRVRDFYRQSRQLVGFIYHQGGKERFARFVKIVAEGQDLEMALSMVYPREWPTVAELDRAFSEKLVVGKRGDDESD